MIDLTLAAPAKQDKKLTEEQVANIKAAIILGYTQKALAAHYNVSIGAIAHISMGKTWKHVAPAQIAVV